MEQAWAEEVSVDVADLTTFADHGAGYRRALEAVEDRVEVRRAAVASRLGLGAVVVPTGRSSRGAMTSLLEQVEAANRFVTDIVADLRDPSVVWLASLPAGHPLAMAVEAELVDRPDGVLLDGVVAAMVDGVSPAEAGIAQVYFPDSYLRLLATDTAIDDLEARRDEADGYDWFPFDGDHGRVGELDRLLDRSRDRRAALADELGTDGGWSVDEVTAVALVGAWVGAGSWEGERHARWVLDYRRRYSRQTADGGTEFDDAGGDETQVHLTGIGERLTTSGEAALAFYQTLGVDGTAHLPTLVADNFAHDGDTEARAVVFAHLGDALGVATRAVDSDGESALGFTGAELVGVERPRTAPNLYWHHPALLLAHGDHAVEFLADAAVATLVRAEAEAGAVGLVDEAATALTGTPLVNPGTMSVIGWHDLLWDSARPRLVTGGEDPRNVLLARAAESTEAAAATVARLAEIDPELGSLLFAEAPFPLTQAGLEATNKRNHHVPDLAMTSPVSAFLVVAGGDETVAATILEAAAGGGMEGRRFSDVGVAGGIDGLMARHAAAIFPDHERARAGLDPTPLVTTPHRWRETHRLVLDRGQGGALAIRVENLLTEAMANQYAQRGEIDADTVDLVAFAAGHLAVEHLEARATYAEGLDDEAERHNTNVNRTVGTALSIAGVMPGAGVPAGLASGGWAWFAPMEPTDNLEQELREQVNRFITTSRDDIYFTWHTQQAILTAMADQGVTTVEMVTEPGGAPRSITFAARDHNGTPVHRWLDPTTNTWQPFDLIYDDQILFTNPALQTAPAAATKLARNYGHGRLHGWDDAPPPETTVADSDGYRDRTDEGDSLAARLAVADWLADG